MTANVRPVDGSKRRHYSYEHYASREVAEGFDALRFGGPIGRYLFETQARLLDEWLSPLEGRTVLDVGAGTGRSAIGLAVGGALVTGLDASAQMLEVARKRAAASLVPVRFAQADAHHLPVAARSVDAALSLRVLMHAIDWRRCVAELCRVARWRVIVDFPAALSFAALESGARRAANALGGKTEAYRILTESGVRTAFAGQGFRVVHVHREFVLPINLHKRVSSLAFTTRVERALAGAGLLRVFGSPVTMVAER